MPKLRAEGAQAPKAAARRDRLPRRAGGVHVPTIRLRRKGFEVRLREAPRGKLRRSRRHGAPQRRKRVDRTKGCKDPRKIGALRAIGAIGAIGTLEPHR